MSRKARPANLPRDARLLRSPRRVREKREGCWVGPSGKDTGAARDYGLLPNKTAPLGHTPYAWDSPSFQLSWTDNFCYFRL